MIELRSTLKKIKCSNKQYQIMVIKNTKLEQKLKETQKELEHCKCLLQAIVSEKENLKRQVNHSQFEFKELSEAFGMCAKRKTEKHVSFSEDKDRQSTISREVEENLDHSVVAKAVGILKIRSSSRNSPIIEDLGHNLPNKTKETKVLSKENLKSSTNSIPNQNERGSKEKCENAEETKQRHSNLSKSDRNNSSEDLSLDSSDSSSSDSSSSSSSSSSNEEDKSQVNSPTKENSNQKAKEEENNKNKTLQPKDEQNKYLTPSKNNFNQKRESMEGTTEIIFEQEDEDKDTTFEVIHEISNSKQSDLNKSKSVKFLNLDITNDMFEIRRIKNETQTFRSPKGSIKDLFGPKAGTLAPRTIYKPQESTEYINSLQRSINNKNYMFLNPSIEGVSHLENSVKVGKKYYQEDDNELLVCVSGRKDRLDSAREHKEQLDFSVVKNLDFEYSKKQFRGIQIADNFCLPSVEEGKYSIGEASLKEAQDTGDITMRADTSEICETNLPFVSNTKVNELGNYNTKYSRFFEEFYIVGVDQLSLGSLNSNKRVSLRPSLIFNYPGREEHKERHDVIKDFCFPNGIEVSKINLCNGDQESEINEVLFCRPVMVENCFLFTINANDYEKKIIYQDEYLNCLAVVTNEIMSTDYNSQEMSGIEEDKLFIVQKAYCLMFRGNHVPLQYQILSTLIKLIKCERTQNIKVNYLDYFEGKQIYKEYEYLLADIYSMISLPSVTLKMNELLSTINSLNPGVYSPEQWLSIETPCSLEPIQYLMPKCENYLDILWHGPFFFCKVAFAEFYLVFKAILLEKSIIFISEDKNLLSSILNGYRVLLKPFKWCHIFISILPKLLSDYICAPQPMLLGITEIDQIIENYSEEDFSYEDKIMIELNQDSVSECMKICGDFEIPECRFGSLEDKLRSLWDQINSESIHDLRQSTYCISDKELDLCKDIAENIESTFDKYIIFWVRKFKQNKTTGDPEDDYNRCKEEVIYHADERDKAFIRQFVETQMFAYLFDTI